VERPVLKEVERLRWRLQRPVLSLLAGPYRSAFKGNGIEFADARPYQPGDDWRRLHWSLSARKNQPYLRLGYEERDLTCVIAIDRSPSMYISPHKVQLWQSAAIALGWAAWLNGDRVQWITFTDRIEGFSGRLRTHLALWESLANLLEQPAQGHRSRLRPLLAWVEKMHHRRAFVIVVSDLFFQEEAPEILLAALAMRHFVLAAVPRSSEENLSIPWGYLPLKEVETGQLATLRGDLRPPAPHPRLRYALLTPDRPLLQPLREALLAPLQ